MLLQQAMVTLFDRVSAVVTVEAAAATYLGDDFVDDDGEVRYWCHCVVLP